MMSSLTAITVIETFMLPDTLGTSKLQIPDEEAIDTLIRQVAREEILSRYQSLQDHEVSGKRSGEIVTEADLQSERRLSQGLIELLPGSTVIGEEAYEANPGIISRFEQQAPVWVLDPLDGTRNYSEGRPCFCVIVALVAKQVTQAGWIFDPLKNIMYSTRRGEGAKREYEPLQTQPAKNLEDMVGSVSKTRRAKIDAQYGTTGTNRPNELVRYRCIGMEYVDMVLGTLDFAEYGNLKPWDHAAGLLLLKESGGHAAHVASKREYVPGPVERSRLIATRTEQNWPDIERLLSD
tara:strand:- start:419 stop:1297 length:879 start_codon:yes stop_codon:yes gene_type:complete